MPRHGRLQYPVVCLPYLGEGALGRVGIGGGRAGAGTARAEFASERRITVVAPGAQFTASAGSVVLKRMRYYYGIGVR